jgi:hypothetical protein
VKGCGQSVLSSPIANELSEKVSRSSTLTWRGLKLRALGTNYGTVLNGGHFVPEPSPVVFFETNGTAISATDAGRSTPIRYAWPPINTVVASTAGQQIINDRGAIYCSPGPTKARIL